MSNEWQWVLFLILVSAGLCRFFYVVGKIKGETEALKRSAEHFRYYASGPD